MEDDVHPHPSGTLSAIPSREEQERSWTPEAGGVWPMELSEDQGWALSRSSRSFSCSSAGEGAVRNVSCPRPEGLRVKEEKVSSSLGSGLLSPTFPCPSPSLSPGFYCLSVSRFPQQRGHKIHSLAFRSLMGRPSVCTVVLLLTYFCKAGIFPSKN